MTNDEKRAPLPDLMLLNRALVAMEPARTHNDEEQHVYAPDVAEHCVRCGEPIIGRVYYANNCGPCCSDECVAQSYRDDERLA